MFGDVHINHPNTTASDTLPLLYRLIREDDAFKQLDMIIIEGDFFDTLMSMNHPAISRIMMWMLSLLKACKKHGIALRILEGTPSHDMKQNEWFVTLNELYGIGTDLRYYADLALERNTKLGVDILYLPDEWDSPLHNCYLAAKKLLKSSGLTQVDYAVMHGNFEYQLPSLLGVPAHSSALWQDLVVFNILIGHIHNASRYGKIVASGSFNRLRHGEETPKGYNSITGHADGRAVVEFIENVDAKIYLTLTLPELDTDGLIRYIHETCDQYPDDSSLKFASKNKILLESVINYARVEYPKLNFTVKYLEDVSEAQKSVLPKVNRNRVGTDILKDNVLNLMRSKLTEQGHTEEFITSALVTLQERVNEL